ncbi:hypothetical protein C8R43DRAFT_965971 [Mycena crocata]|nr:hypothetical protein C8R43DRAFT_965971 [Mycena crocata]
MPPRSEPLNLTPNEVATLISPTNHPQPLSVDELDRLTAHLSAQEVEQVIDRLGLAVFARQLPPLFHKLLRAVQRITRDTPPEEDEELERLTRRLHVNARSVPSTPQHRGSTTYLVHTPDEDLITTSWFEAAALTQGKRGFSVQASPQASRAHKPPASAFVVFFGGDVAVFTRWGDVQRSITGHGLAIHCGFSSVAAANEALAYARSRGWTADSSPPEGQNTSPLPFPSSHDDNPLNSDSRSTLWYAVCRGVVPGVYRSYLECSLNTSGVKGNLCNSFDTREAAETALSQAYKAGWVRHIARTRSLRS